MKRLAFICVLLILASCERAPSEKEITSIIEECLAKEPIYDRVELNLSDSLKLDDKQIKLYKKLEKEGLIHLKETFKESESRWKVTATEKAEDFVLHRERDSSGTSVSFRLSVFKLDAINDIQHIPSSDVTLVDAIFQSGDPTPFYEALKEDLVDKVPNQITLTKNEDGSWQWCD